MDLLLTRDRIKELLARFVARIENDTAMQHTDANRVAEDVLIPLLNEVYGLNLKNLNTEEANYPAVDLGDEDARVAFQVTSTPRSDKVKKTLRTFADHRLYETYGWVRFYILTTKQKSYGGAGFKNIVGDRFRFDPKRDILDRTDLLREVNAFPLDKAHRVLDILEAHFGDAKKATFNRHRFLDEVAAEFGRESRLPEFIPLRVLPYGTSEKNRPQPSTRTVKNQTRSTYGQGKLGSSTSSPRRVPCSWWGQLEAERRAR